MTVVDHYRNTRTFVEECWAELKKVTWPDWEQLKNSTLVVIAFTVIISFIIWIMDSVVRILLAQIMGIFGA